MSFYLEVTSSGARVERLKLATYLTMILFFFSQILVKE